MTSGTSAPVVPLTAVPRLRAGARLSFDPGRDRYVVLFPEGVLLLNETAAAVVGRCDGVSSVAGIVAELAERYDSVDPQQVAGAVTGLARCGVLAVEGGTPTGTATADGPTAGPAPEPTDAEAGIPAPLDLLAELTHRCPLHCSYCSNPVDLVPRRAELTTEQWLSVLSQARELGVLQVHFSGGEPLTRPDLLELVSHANRLGCYTNLVTSGLGLTPALAAELTARGLDHVQLSLQDADPAQADIVAGARAHQHKTEAARLVKRLGLPLTVNVVLHRGNLDRVAQIIELAESLGADRLELANTQYYGWALRNRRALLPRRAQLEAAEAAVRQARQRLGDRMQIVYVLADYHEPHPKPCQHGWGAQQLTVTPDGRVLPCPVADVIDELRFENVRSVPLAEIWYRSPAFNAFRGTGWMQEPCRSCPRREVDHGGCRCQAFLFTGDPTATDPVCTLSPHRHLVDAVLGEEESSRPVPRTAPREAV